MATKKKKETLSNAGELASFTKLASMPTAEVSSMDTAIRNNRYAVITLNRQLLTNMFLEHGLIQTYIQQVVDDAFRGGITIKCDEFGEDELTQLYQKIEECGDIEAVVEAEYWKRLFGGAGLIINAGQKFDEEFKIENIKQGADIKFVPADRWELAWTPTGNILDALKEHSLEVPYNYYGHKLHKTAVLRFEGKKAPSMIRGQFGGWGVSEIEGLLRSWNQYLKNQEVVFELMDEAKVDVFMIDGFAQSLSTSEGIQATASRVQMAAQLKNYKNALVMDKEDVYEQKQVNFSGLAETLQEIRKGICCDTRYPMTKLFGMSSAGFNAGDDDIENYNAKIESEIRSKDRGAIIAMLKIRCQQLFGHIPENLSFEYKPLRILSHNEEEDMKGKKLARILDQKREGLMTSSVAAEQINALEINPIKLNPNEVEDAPLEKEPAEGVGTRDDEGNVEQGTEGEDSGAA
jgi:hypothetical protein